ncbi:hypothetical protein AMAG_01978 [Allomyces macrogynus ATCC 38327]|uniref:Uncharacterized protein n=1 Tax=Allomyces macrogynus (strain ATCC 38327) TaxID=578462 RepID=A0A0L0S0J6_ALLM3|nr:hypothetical protein AMAG_01978 [Allomyces macrogynus ATCC 38327]|eukprot:KNE56142.1 hypothetical protein AMAG_01978 [Allomyces macrogynus ATCC 38327]
MYPPPPPPLPPTPHGAVHRSATDDAAGVPSPSCDMGAPQPSPRMPRTAPHLRDQPPAPPVVADQRVGMAPPAIEPPPRPSQTRYWQLRLGQYEFGERMHDLVLLCTNLGGTTPADETSGTWYMNPVDLARLLCGLDHLNPKLIADPRYQSALCMCPISKTPHLDRAMVREVAACGENHQLHALAQFTATELATAADANARGVRRVLDDNVGVARTILRELQIVGEPLPFPVPGMLLIAPHYSSALSTPVAAGPMSPSNAAAPRLALPPPPPPPESPLRSPTAPGPSQPPQAIGAAGAPSAAHDSTPMSAPPESSVQTLLYVPPPPASAPSAQPPTAPASSVPPPPPPPAPAAVVLSTTPEVNSGLETIGKRPRASMSHGSGATPTRGGRAQGGRSRGPSMSEGNPRKRARIEIDENATAMDGVQAVVAATGVSSSTVRRLSVGHAALTVPSEQQREIQRIREEQQSRIAQQNKRAQAAVGVAGGAASEPTTPAPTEPALEEEPADEPMEDSPESESPPPPPPTKRRGRPKKEKPAVVDEAPVAPAPTLATLLTGPTTEGGDASASTPALTQPAPHALLPVLPPPPVPAPSIIPALLPSPLPLSSIVSPAGGADAAAAPSVIVEPASFGVRYPTAPHLSRPDFLNTAATASDPSLPYSTAPVVIPPLHVADTRQVETAPPPPVRRRISSSRLSTGSSRRHAPPPPPPPVLSMRDVAMHDASAAPTDARSPAPPAAAGTGALRTEFLAVMAAVFDSVTTRSRPVTQHLSPALLAALAPVVATPVPAAPPAPPVSDLADQLTALVDRIAPLEGLVRAVETAEVERARAAEIAEADRVRATERAAAADALAERLTALETRLGAVAGGDADRAAGLVDRVAALETRAQQSDENPDADRAAVIAQLVERVTALENQVCDTDRTADAALVARVGELEDRLQAMQEERVTAESALVKRIAPLEDRVRDVENCDNEQITALADRVAVVEGQAARATPESAFVKRIAPLEDRVRDVENCDNEQITVLADRVAVVEGQATRAVHRLRSVEKNAVDCAALADRITPIENRLRVMEGDLGDHLVLANRIALLEQQVHDMKEGGVGHVTAAVADHLDPLKEGLAMLQTSHTDLERTTKSKERATAKDLKRHEAWVADQLAALNDWLVRLDDHVATVTDQTEALGTRHAALEPRIRALEGAARDGDHAAANHQGGGVRRPAARHPPGNGEYPGAFGQTGGARRAAARPATPARPSPFDESAAPMSRKDDGADGPQRRSSGRAE